MSTVQVTEQTYTITVTPSSFEQNSIDVAVTTPIESINIEAATESVEAVIGSLLIPDNISLVGHTHTSSEITDFNSATSGLLPSVTGTGYATSTFANNVYTIEITGVQPSGNYSTVGHTHTASNITDFDITVSGLLPAEIIVEGSGYVIVNENNSTYTVIVTGLQPSGDYSIEGHTHTANEITDFNSAVSGLLPSIPATITVAGSGYIVVTEDANIYTVEVTGLQPSGNYSLDGHTHLSSDITDFGTAVSGLLPTEINVEGSGYAVAELNNDTYTIFVTGLQPSGNYSLDNHTHISNDITDFNASVSGLLINYAPLISPNFSGIPTSPTAPSGTNTNQIASTAFVRAEISNLVESAPAVLDTLNELAAALGDDPNFATTVASGLAQKSDIGHTHIASSITDFNSATSGLLPSVTGTGYATSTFANNVYTIAITGVQPSGNYSLAGHTHTASEITDFNSSVSGLLPITSLTAGSGIDISNSGTDYTVSVTGDFGLTSEQVDDRINSLLVAGSYIILNYDDLGDSLTISTSGLQPSGDYSLVGHTHTANEITDFNSAVSGLLPTIPATISVAGSGYVAVTEDNNVYTIEVTGLQPSGDYSINGHTHNSNDITDFDTSVIALLPTISGTLGYLPKFNDIDELGNSVIYQSGTNIGIGTTSPSGLLDIAGSVYVRGPSNSLGTIYIKTGTGIADTSCKVRGDNSGNLYLDAGAYVKVGNQDGTAMVMGYTGPVTIGHISNSSINQNIIFKPRSIERARLTHDGKFGIGTDTPLYTLDITGSGNFSENLFVNNIPVSISGHTHTATDITDFAASVSGLLPVKDIVGGSGISVVSNSGIYTVDIILEDIQDNLGNSFLVAGNNINLDYVDASGILTINTVTAPAFDKIQLDLDAAPILTQGQIGWNDTEGTMDIALTDDATINVGEHNVYRIRNTTGSVLYKGQVVYASGVHSNGIITPDLYVSDGTIREIRFIGLVLEDINDNNNGYAMNFGHINNIDTRGNVASPFAVGDETWVAGDILYVHPTIPGKLTNIEPKHSISAAIILDAASNGKIFVRPTSYGHLDDNHDVNISGVTHGQFLQYDSSTDYWIPSSSGDFTTLLVNGTGVALDNHTHGNITNDGKIGSIANQIVVTTTDGLLTTTDTIDGGNY
jgi:hypothetical protein